MAGLLGDSMLTILNAVARATKAKEIFEPVGTEVVEIFTDLKPSAAFVTGDLTTDPLELEIVLYNGGKQMKPVIHTLDGLQHPG